MRILWLNAGLLLPLDKGGKLRTWHLMRHLAKDHVITYVSFAPAATTQATYDGMREVCADLHVIPRDDAAKGTLTFYAGAAARVFDPLPYAAGTYRSAAYRHRVDELLATRTFDLLVCDFLVPAVNLSRSLPCPAVLFTHNVESDIWRRHTERQTNLGSRWLFRQQWRRMHRFEGRTLGRFDLVLTVSDTDRDTLQRLYAPTLRAPVVTVATGVDTSFFAPRHEAAVRPYHLVFTGSMDWLPNEDAMIYFCYAILPRIRAQEPDATLTIVGRAPTPAVRKLADLPGVEVTGRVDDVRDYIDAAAVYVVPLRIGGGTRLKIFEAMAMGKAVVSTTIGAEGLPVTHGVDVVLADDADAFAGAVITLLRDPARRVQIESAARALVIARYDWSAVAGQLNDALVGAATRSAPVSAFADAQAPHPRRGGMSGRTRATEPMTESVREQRT